MKSVLFYGGLLLLTAGAVAPLTAVAGGVPGMDLSCCTHCAKPPSVCTCTTYHPVVDTWYRRENFTVMRDVQKTVCRQEPCVETFPVTKVDCITVDEGCYKMVWCPKPVTKHIPRTELHQRTTMRTVVDQVTCQVPEMCSRVVPECRVRYVPRTQTFVCNDGACPSCPTGGCCPSGMAEPHAHGPAIGSNSATDAYQADIAAATPAANDTFTQIQPRNPANGAPRGKFSPAPSASRVRGLMRGSRQ